MIDYLSKERLGIMLTTLCNLKCRGCYLMIPRQRPWNADAGRVIASLPRIFEIFDRFEQICLMGGEPFLYKAEDLIRILGALDGFKRQFGFVRIVTNATIVPEARLLEALRGLGYHADVRISNYGEHSHKRAELAEALAAHGIHATTVNYTDEEQYHGGWVDFGVNWAFRGYSGERLAELYENCNYKTFFNWGSYIYRCPTVSGAVQLGELDVPDGEKIDIFSDESVESKRAKAARLIAKPQEACRYCDSFDAEGGARFKAGEQI
jgi:MoaA/NifB/PqqE/SkfB family radical SAM enzyme